MRRLPELNDGQVAVLLADRQTGHILNLSMTWSIDPEEEVFRVFDTETEAITFIGRLQDSGADIEGVVHRADEDGVRFIP